VGIILIYNLRLFERFMGSRKFGALVCLSGGIATLSNVAIMTILASMDMDHIYPSPGPFFFIYSLIPLFYRKFIEFIPIVHVVTVNA
jgi:hypothetical protein